MNIKNFIFFDIETTGLPYEEYNKTKITEICFIAVQSDHINLGVYPRVQNKLALCFNPQKLINPKATEITGLANDLLEFQPVFAEKACQIINNFLELQQKPICLVAHNGNFFDYPILKSEFYKAGCELNDNILCIDSLELFRNLDSAKITIPDDNDSKHVLTENIEITQPSLNCLPTQKAVPIELSDEFDQFLFDLVDNIENSVPTSVKTIQSLNESTPTKSNKVINISNNKTNNTSLKHLYYIPPTSSNNKATLATGSSTQETIQRSSSKTRRQLNFGKPSYKLIDVYKRMTNRNNENAHLANEDVNMLIHCAATLGEEFVDWANANAKMLTAIKMMEPGVKL